ncbi:DUF481 domain-containing protein [Alteromonas sp. ASW11-130]|uniref:DUF481 domain-containing protein n=1 Tax=Alteromonas sp. ASW11-130 TaxID=3015775 RepID=UPI0022421BBD|nr:DUF481 domain-containing protein [Alteromonas sp. ASW11-130]MCW8091588.1 DUF481 domain-containing protein [Alteromonas sp. ASW11-130]
MKRSLLAVAIVGSLATNIAIAQQDKKPFTMEGGVGGIYTTGNTETTSLSASLVAHQELPEWSNDYNIEGLYKKETVQNDEGEDEERTSAEKLFASSQANYKLTNPDYRVFGFASYEQDKLSNYEYQTTLAVGWNHKLWETDKMSFEYSVGPGYAWAETQEGEQQDGPIVRASAAYQWLISETAKFTQTVSTEVGEDNTKSRAETAVSATISGNLSLKVALKLDHNSDVDPGIEKLDTETSITLVYSFF